MRPWRSGVVGTPAVPKHVADFTERDACLDRFNDRGHQIGVRDCGAGHLSQARPNLAVIPGGSFRSEPLDLSLLEAPIVGLPDPRDSFVFGMLVDPDHRPGARLDIHLETIRRLVDFFLHEVDGL